MEAGSHYRELRTPSSVGTDLDSRSTGVRSLRPAEWSAEEEFRRKFAISIFRMVTENPTWGAPRIHGELLMLGFDVSERTISRWMRRAPRDPEPAKRWLAFLRNHREAIAAMDFFTVPTVTFGVLYCFFVIDHGRRRILHFNVTRHPTSLWVVQQLREAFPYQSAPRFLIFDRDAKYGLEVPIAVRSMAIRPCAPRSEVPGRTELRSGGSKAVGAICWTTSSPSTSAT